jgi:hypothetical protein
MKTTKQRTKRDATKQDGSGTTTAPEPASTPAPVPAVDYTARSVAPAPSAGQPGRPPLWKQAFVREKIISLVRGGNYAETAAAAAGVSVHSLRNWMKQAGDIERRMAEDPTYTMTPDEETLVGFFTAVEQAKAEAESRDILLIGKAATKDWKAAAWRASHRAPERWGRNLVEVSGRDGGPVQHEDVSGDPLDVLAAKLDALAKQKQQTPAVIERDVPATPDAE